MDLRERQQPSDGLRRAAGGALVLDLRPMAPSDDERKRVEQSYLRYAGAGVEFFAAIAVLTLLGVWVDGRLGTSPVLTIVGVLIGFAAATWNLIRSVLPPSGPTQKQDGQP